MQFTKKLLYWQRYIEINSVSMFPTIFEYISSFSKVPLNEGETGTINSYLMSLRETFCYADQKFRSWININIIL